MKTIQPLTALKSRYANNGQMTRHLEKVIKAGVRGEELGTFVERLCDRFVLSSTHVVYDDMLTSLDAATKKVILDACIQSDHRKGERSEAFCKEQGMSDKEAREMAWSGGKYGRAKR